MVVDHLTSWCGYTINSKHKFIYTNFLKYTDFRRSRVRRIYVFFVSSVDAIGHHSVVLHLSNDFSSVTRSTTFQSRFGRFFKGKHSHCGV